MWAHAGKVTYLCLGSLEADVRDAANYVQDRYQLGDVGKGDKDVNANVDGMPALALFW